MSDTELWQAWRERGDAEAFTTLVERYLDMVYATARRILGNPHDAEDVTQDCFIALLKGRVKVQHPLGPWLHRVARNRALDKIKVESRRRERERTWSAESPEAIEPGIDDILAHIDAAIEVLPADQRAAIIGRFLEGKTNQALGDALGVGESTIRYRIGQGVEGIRATLKERGVITTAAALGALLENNLAGAAPSGLKAAVAKLALATPVPAPPGRVVRLGRVALIAGVSAAVLGLLFAASAVLSGREPVAQVRETTSTRPDTANATFDVPPVEAPVENSVEGLNVQTSSSKAVNSATPAPEASEWVEPASTVSGTIFDERGYPLPGAMVTVVSHGSSHSLRGTEVFNGTTDANGRYSISGVRHQKTYQGYKTTHRPGAEPKFSGLIRLDPPNLSPFLQVWVSASGYLTKGEQSVSLEAGGTKQGVDFTLSPAVSVRGRVVWPDGRPVECAAVILRSLRDFRGELTWGSADFTSTDATGLYQFGVMREGTLALLVVAPNGDSGLFTDVAAYEQEVPTLTMKASAALTGTVRNTDGTPLVHAAVIVEGRYPLTDNPDYARQVESRKFNDIGSASIESAFTDKYGAFAFPALAAVPDALLWIAAPRLEETGPSERLLTRHIGALPAGASKILDVVLPGADERMTLNITVVGEPSGEPLPFTGVMFGHRDDEMEISLRPDSDAPYYPVERRLTEPGTYEVWPHYNGRVDGDERSLFGQEVKWEPGTVKSITFRLPDPYSLAASVMDPSGDPISGAEVAARLDGGGIWSGTTDESGTFRWNGFKPHAEGYLSAHKEGYSRNESVAIVGEPGVEYPEQTILLYPTGGVEGRLVTADGDPVAGKYVGLRFDAETITWLQLQKYANDCVTTIMTSADGSFVWLDGLPAVPGSLTVTSHGTLQSGPISVEVTAGEVLQLGDLVLQVSEEP